MNSNSTSTKQVPRKRIGEWAIKEGLVSRSHVADALKAQKELEKIGLGEKLGQILVKKKWITLETLDLLLRLQRGETRRLGNYEILKKIGQGGMGVVFKARQITMDRIVALKILAPTFADDPSFIKRFVREARAAGQFSHENIVTSVEVGFEKPYHYLVMDYVEGRSLLKIIKERGPLPEKEAVTYTLHVARALKHALGKKVIHRDVKPDNVMITPAGVAKLLDMGLACVVDAQSGSADDEKAKEEVKRSTGLKAVGTPHYISPEAARGSRDIDTRTDIYSLGCSLYHMLTGTTPFTGRGRQIMTAHLTDAVPSPKKKRTDCSTAVCQIFGKMTAKLKEQRYDNPSELIEDLEALLAGKKLKHVASSEKSGRSLRALTTGPRSPIGARGTTGPRAAVRPMGTTGPAAPIRGSRGKRSQATASIGSGASGRSPMASKQPPSSSKMVVGIGMAATVMLGGFGLFLFSGKPMPVRSANRNVSSKAGKMKTARIQASEVEGRQTLPVALKPKVDPVISKAAEAETLRKEFEALKQSLKGKPDAFAEYLPRFDRFVRIAVESSLIKEINDVHEQLKKKWQEGFDSEIEARLAKANEALQHLKYSAALQQFKPDDFPANLRAEQWRPVLNEKRAAMLGRIRSEAESILSNADAKARGESAKDLQVAFEALERLAELPSELPTLIKQVTEKKVTYGKLQQDLQAKEVVRIKALAVATLGRLKALRKELAPLLRAGKHARARDQLSEKLVDPQWKPVKAALRAERSDIDAVLALKELAMNNLVKREGEKVQLRGARTNLKGKISKAASGKGVALKLAGGAVITLRPDQLDAMDIERFVAVKQTTSADVLKGLGLLFLYAGDAAKAGDYFSKAQKAGLVNGVEGYLERVQILKLGEKEVLAANAWNELQPLIKGKKWKEIIVALKAYSVRFETTAFVKQHAEEIEGAFRLATEKDMLGNLSLKGLQMRMAFNEGQGDKVAGANGAKVPSKIVGLLRGTPIWTRGVRGAALNFDGKDDLVDVRIDVSETAFAVGLWVKPEDPNCGIFAITTENGKGHDRHLWLAGGQLKTRVWNNEVLTVSDINLADGKWHHILLQYGADLKGTQVFVDGTLQVSGKKAFSDFKWQTTAWIGYSHDAAKKYFKGVLDEVVIYERTLKAEEVKALSFRN